MILSAIQCCALPLHARHLCGPIAICVNRQRLFHALRLFNVTSTHSALSCRGERDIAAFLNLHFVVSLLVASHGYFTGVAGVHSNVGATPIPDHRNEEGLNAGFN